MSSQKKRSVAENRTDGSQAPRPKDASTLILYRQSRNNIEILMGERSARHSFLPNTYVFPGGRVDPSDSRIPAARGLREDVLTRLCRGGCSPSRAHGLAVAAIRETFEETGLRLAASHPMPKISKVNVWNEFGTSTCGPDLSKLDYIARAVTPPSRKKRFNTRFFVADADTLEGEMKGSGELLDLKWVTLKEALDLDIPLITERVLGYADTFFKTRPEPSAMMPVPMFQMRYGKRVFAEE